MQLQRQLWHQQQQQQQQEEVVVVLASSVLRWPLPLQPPA
jgi:hypothetical protein